MAWTESLKKAQNTLIVKVQPSCSEDVGILEMPISWANHLGHQQMENGASLTLEDKLRTQWLPKPFEGAQKTVNESQKSDTDFTLLEFDFALFRL